MEGSFSSPSPEGQPASRAAFRRFPLCPALQLQEQKEPVVGNVPVPGVCDAGLWLLALVGIDH